MPHSSVDVAHFTRYFPYWQGLRWIPVGLASLVAAAVLGGLGTIERSFVLLLVAAAGVIAGEIIVDQFYIRRYGWVREQRSRRHRSLALRAVAIAAAVMVALVDLAVRWPVLLSGLVAAAALLGFWFVSGKGRNHWLLLALLPVAAAFTPAIGLTSAGRESLAVLLVVGSVAQVAGGVLDHRIFTQRLQEMRRHAKQ